MFIGTTVSKSEHSQASEGPPVNLGAERRLKSSNIQVWSISHQFPAILVESHHDAVVHDLHMVQEQRVVHYCSLEYRLKEKFRTMYTRICIWGHKVRKEKIKLATKLKQATNSRSRHQIDLHSKAVIPEQK